MMSDNYIGEKDYSEYSMLKKVCQVGENRIRSPFLLTNNEILCIIARDDVIHLIFKFLGTQNFEVNLHIP
jgi:hypothetical protein